MREGDASQALRCGAEYAHAHAGPMQPPQRSRHVGVTAEVDGGPLLGVALEQLRPIRQLLVERGHVHTEAARRVLDPVVPERLDVAEGAELDSNRLHDCRTRSQTSMPSASPTASMPTSMGDAWRPRTKCWWNSSVAAYAMPTASASASRPSAR